MLDVCGGLGKKASEKALALPSFVLISAAKPSGPMTFRAGLAAVERPVRPVL